MEPRGREAPAALRVCSSARHRRALSGSVPTAAAPAVCPLCRSHGPRGQEVRLGWPGVQCVSASVPGGRPRPSPPQLKQEQPILQFRLVPSPGVAVQVRSSGVRQGLGHELCPLTFLWSRSLSVLVKLLTGLDRHVTPSFPQSDPASVGWQHAAHSGAWPDAFSDGAVPCPRCPLPSPPRCPALRRLAPGRSPEGCGFSACPVRTLLAVPSHLLRG